MGDTKIKDYSGKTAEEWLAERKWTGFLLSVPIGSETEYRVMDSNDAMSIRATASMLNHNINCNRRFRVKVNFDTRIVTVNVAEI